MIRTRKYLFALAVFAAIPSARADSIWDRRDPRAAYLFQDNRARAVGDILSIAITETTTSNDREQRAGDRRTRNDAALNITGNYQVGSAPGNSGSVIGSGNSDLRRRFDGTSQLTTDRRFVDRMAVTVVDVLPNGNLVFEGYRMRVIAGEERALRVTGVVRAADIGAQNTVLSQYVANFKISYVGRGSQTEFTSQGFFGRMMNHVLP